MTNAECQEKIDLRAALYIDGFNLYHPIHDTGENHLKWACLWKLGELLCEKGGQRLVRVVFCTAVPAHMPEKRDRHNKFNAAQVAAGVTVVKGHHVPEPDKGGYSEKQSDINLAMSVIFDGLDDQYDVAFLLTADTDQVATARFFSERLVPLGKTLIGVAPIDRKPPKQYSEYGIRSITLTKYQLECCILPEVIQGKSGAIIRPPEYAPPINWVHPDARPKGKPQKVPKAAWGKVYKG